MWAPAGETAFGITRMCDAKSTGVTSASHRAGLGATIVITADSVINVLQIAVTADSPNNDRLADSDLPATSDHPATSDSRAANVHLVNSDSLANNDHLVRKGLPIGSVPRAATVAPGVSVAVLESPWLLRAGIALPPRDDAQMGAAGGKRS